MNAAIQGEAVRRRLRHVYWVGGGSGGGKSTVTQRLAWSNHY